MNLVKLLAAATAALALLASPSAPAAAQETVTVRLAAVGGSGVSGTATLTATDSGTAVLLDVAGLPAGASARATEHAGTCAQPSASFAELPTLSADASGRATVMGRVLFRASQDVALATIADGAHVIAVAVGEQRVACGTIPSPGAGARPSRLPATGGAPPEALPSAAAAAGTAGLAAVLAVVAVRRRLRWARR